MTWISKKRLAELVRVTESLSDELASTRAECARLRRAQASGQSRQDGERDSIRNVALVRALQFYESRGGTPYQVAAAAALFEDHLRGRNTPEHMSYARKIFCPLDDVAEPTS